MCLLYLEKTLEDIVGGFRSESFLYVYGKAGFGSSLKLVLHMLLV
jgi:hypothetical protein